jgi:hypothetical protein
MIFVDDHLSRGMAANCRSMSSINRFAIDYVDPGEAIHNANLIYLWGERPPKAFPIATPEGTIHGTRGKIVVLAGYRAQTRK